MSTHLINLLGRHMDWSLDQYAFHADSFHESMTMLTTFSGWLEEASYASGWSWYDNFIKRYPVLRGCSKRDVRRMYALI